MGNVLDLDVLRPADAKVVLGGNEIDVSFIPLALTWDINDLLTQTSALTKDGELDADDPKLAKEGFALSVKMCVVFCAHQYPEMDEAWFDQYASMGDIIVLGTKIREALTRAYEGIDQKNE